MFGRRNPDTPPATLPPTPPEDELNLDLLPDIPDLPSPERAAPPAERIELPPPLPGDPAWYASAPVTPALSPAVTQRLPIPAAPPAESSAAPPILEPAAPPAAPPAPAPLPSAASSPAPSPAAAITSALMKSAGAQPQPQTAESVIGPDDFFDGRYRSERGVRIQGNARGSIESRQYIFVEAGAEVEAELSAEDITVSGRINGTVTCRRRLEILATGKVQGQIQSALLVVHEGGLLDGELHMRSDDAPPAAPGASSEPSAR